eukprot:780464-Pyramimonas_sp.AAC.1
MAIEAKADWPSSFITKMALIPKADGGLRPSVLFAAVIRAHGRLRRPLMQKWENDNDRPYWWACSGRACGKALWQQQTRSEWVAMMAELHTDQDWASASILLD